MDYRATLCQALNLPATATDAEITARCVDVLGAVLLALDAGAKPFSAMSGRPISFSLQAEIKQAVAELSGFSATRRQTCDTAELQIARQMGVSSEALTLYGAKTRA